MSRAKKVGGVMTYSQMMAALVKEFPPREYAFLTEVRNGTGFSSRVRTADAVALSLWPSRGLGLHGFEFKQYRGDWLREKDEPAKAEAIAQYCDYWWLVVTDARIAPLEEVPETWGLKAPSEDATSLVTLKTAVKMPAKELSRSFVASLLRNAADAMTPNAVVSERVEEARQLGYRQAQKAHVDGRELKRLSAIADAAKSFEDASGLYFQDVNNWSPHTAKQIGEAVKLILKGGDELSWRLRSLERTEESVKEMLAAVRKQLATVKGAASGLVVESER